MEKLLEDGINKIGLGPQGMAGNYSVMGVHIENTETLRLLVSSKCGCWSHRRGHIKFDKDELYYYFTFGGDTMSQKNNNHPIKAEDLEDVKVGDIIYLNGHIVTCRDVAHRRLIEEKEHYMDLDGLYFSRWTYRKTSW